MTTRQEALRSPEHFESEDSYANMLAILTAQLVEEETAREAAEQRSAKLQERLAAALESASGLQGQLAGLREQITASVGATQETMQRLGDRFEAGLAALTGKLVEPEPPPQELEFYVRRDATGQVSSVVAKGKS